MFSDMTDTLPTNASTAKASAPPLFDVAYEAVQRVGKLAQRNAFSGRSTPRDLIRKVWDGWQVVAQAPVHQGLEDAYVLRRGEEWAVTTVRTVTQRVSDGAAVVVAQWEDMTDVERRWRFDESARCAVAARSFDDLLEGLCARIRISNEAEEQTAAELVALAMTAAHGHQQNALRFFLGLQRVLPQVDRATRRLRRAKQNSEG